MDNRMFKRNGSNVWPYVIVGSAIGGAVGFLFMTKSGRKVRRTLTRPEELQDNIEGVRDFVEKQARVVTDHVHDILSKAKMGIEEGQEAYEQAGQAYRMRARQVEAKNNRITSSVHNSVDNINRTAINIERSV